MKRRTRIPKIISRGLISGWLKMTPEVLDLIKRLNDTAPSEGPLTGSRSGVAGPPKPASLPKKDAASDSPSGQSLSCAPAREKRMVFASPLPGRWIRYANLLLLASLLSLTPIAHADATAVASLAAPKSVVGGSFDNGPSPGMVILNYERAHLLAPRDEAIVANLKLAREQAGLPSEPTSRLQCSAQTLSWNTWSGLAAAALLLISASLPLQLLAPQSRLAWRNTGIVSAIVFLAAIDAMALRRPELSRAIVTGPAAAARISPVTVVPSLFTLRAGESVNLKQTHGAFALITNSQGQNGWVPRETITPIIPSQRQPSSTPQ